MADSGIDDVTWPELIHGVAESLPACTRPSPQSDRLLTAVRSRSSWPPVIDQHPALEDVPVLWPRGGGYCLPPCRAGRPSWLVVFCEQDFRRGVERKRDGSALLSATVYCLAIPGACS